MLHFLAGKTPFQAAMPAVINETVTLTSPQKTGPGIFAPSPPLFFPAAAKLQVWNFIQTPKHALPLTTVDHRRETYIVINTQTSLLSALWSFEGK